MLGQKIKQYLDDNGITYSFVANKVGKTNQIFSAMLNGKRNIGAEEYFEICQALGVDVSYFVSLPQKTA